MRRIVVILLAVGVLAIAAFRVLRRPPAEHHSPSHKFRAYLGDPQSRIVAYSPTAEILRDGTHRALRAQLATLHEKFDGLSLYQSSPETPVIVEVARELGYKAVLLTVWDPRAESELATASSIVRNQGDAMALAISLGSEGLMEKRYTFADIEAARTELLDRSTSNATVEMTTTEPWWLYLKPEGRTLLDFGEFASVNIHVVWDTDIVDPAIAASWTRDRANEVQAAIKHPLLVREAGFPGAGTSPRSSVHLTFTRDLQAGLWQSWSALQSRPACVFFEAYDNPEKHWRDFESSWGLLNNTATPWPAWNMIPHLAGHAAVPTKAE
jgi:exo-beta-1,3-glucanase (GH17 family)